MPLMAKTIMDRLINKSQDAVFRLDSEPTTTLDYVKLVTFLDEIQGEVCGCLCVCVHLMNYISILAHGRNSHYCQ